MDGASADGTVELIKSREAELDYWCSQPDSGVYQAWNRALKHATGDYVCFLGADDRWAGPRSLEQLMSLTSKKPDIVCSKCRVEWPGEHARVIGAPWAWATLCKGMNLSHHGLLHKSDLFKVHGGFDESFKIAGDYEFLVRCGSGIDAVFHDRVTIIAGGSGVSFRRPFDSLRERYRVQRMHRTTTLTGAIAHFITAYCRFHYARLKAGLRNLLRSGS